MLTCDGLTTCSGTQRSPTYAEVSNRNGTRPSRVSPGQRSVVLGTDGNLNHALALGLVGGAGVRVANRRTGIDGLEPSRLLEANTASWRAYWPEVERRCWLGEADVLDASREVWRRALLECGHDDESLVDTAFDTHQRIGREMDRLFGDVHAFLADVRSNGILIALVTNSSSRSQREGLSSIGLGGAFDHLVISGELGIARPDAAIFHETLSRLEVSASDAWHIGDSLSTDIGGAAAAGIRSVWLNRAGRTASPNDP